MKTLSTFFCLAFAFCISISITVNAQVKEKDSLALVDLYNNTSGPLWTHHENWLTGPVKSWYGIEVTNKRVTAIVLYENNLAGYLPSSLKNLSKLHELYLFENQLMGSIPRGLGNLTELSNLALYRNQLSGSIPPELGNISGLTSLHLQHNQLSGNIPPELGNLSALNSLNLSENQLSGHIPPELGNLSNLVELLISENQLSGSIPKELGNLLNLVFLDLSINQLSGHIPTELCKLLNLYSVKLFRNQLGGPIPNKIGKLKNLKYLSVYQNQLSGPIPSSMSGLTKLEELNLSNNLFTFAGMEMVAQNFPFAKYINQGLIPIRLKNNVLSVSAGGSLINNTYEWHKGGSPQKITIKGDSVFHPTESGIYAVRVTNKIADGVKLTSDTITYKAPALQSSFSSNSRQAISNNGFSVFPNPAKDMLHVRLNGTAPFSLLDQSGKTLLTTNINKAVSINISGFPAGVYYVKNNSTNAVEKIYIVR